MPSRLAREPLVQRIGGSPRRGQAAAVPMASRRARERRAPCASRASARESPHCSTASPSPLPRHASRRPHSASDAPLLPLRPRAKSPPARGAPRPARARRSGAPCEPWVVPACERELAAGATCGFEWVCMAAVTRVGAHPGRAGGISAAAREGAERETRERSPVWVRTTLHASHAARGMPGRFFGSRASHRFGS